MISSRWRKLAGDLSVNKLRTTFVVLAICIGIFGISVIANSYSILMREMDKNYMNTNPASATLVINQLCDAEVNKVRDLSYIKDAEKRVKVVGRVQIGENEWKDIWIYVINDFNDIRLNTFTSESGKAVPGKGEVLFERKALGLANAEVGQSVTIRIPGGNPATLKLSGSVHDPGLAPAWMEGYAYGYITRDTLKLLGGTSDLSELKVLVSEDALNKQHIKDVSVKLKASLEKDGYQVTHIEIPRPGKHPHYDQMLTLLFLMEVFGLLALLLSGVLVANLITSIMEQQTRPIGIMKAVGASSLQIAGLYQAMVMVLAVTAMLVSIPAGIMGGRGYAWVAAEMLNFKISSYQIPHYVLLLEIALGLLIPSLAASIPIFKCSRITVREAINDYGIKQEKYAYDKEDFLTKKFKQLPRPFILSLRNTFRKKERLIFTMLVIALGGTGFIVAMNIYASMYNTVEERINAFQYDIQIEFDQPQRAELIENTIGKVVGVSDLEAWGGASVSRVYRDGTTGNSFNIMAPPSETKLLTAPPMYSGRWLRPDDENAIVINQRVLSNEPDIKIGDSITLRINKTDTTWTVIGISKELMGRPGSYANSEYLAKALHQDGYARNAVIVTDNQNSSSHAAVAKRIERDLADQGIQISSLIKIADYQKALEDHLLIIATFLIIMSILVIIVGGLGLATTISINTLERTREIGIMRAVGASPRSLSAIIVTEGIIIGLLSWMIAVLLSWPLSKFVSYNFGMIFFEAPLEFTSSASGIMIWFAIVIVFAALASFYPSWKAVKMPVRVAISYE